MNIQDALPYINILGFILLFSGYLFAQFRFGGRDVTKEVIATYKVRQDQLEALLKEAQERITQLGLDLATMQGQLLEKDKKLEEFTKIFQGKSPELVEILKEIKDFMKKLSEQINTNEKRNQVIDKDTASERGKVMRKK